MTVLHETTTGIHLGPREGGGQSYDLIRTVEVSTGRHLRRLRLTVHVDASYPRQSRYYASVWTEDGWQEVARILGDDPAWKPMHAVQGPDKDESNRQRQRFVDAVADALTLQAIAVLA